MTSGQPDYMDDTEYRHVEGDLRVALDALTQRHPALLAHEPFIGERLAQLAHRAYQAGAMVALNSLRSSDDAAAELGISRRQVQTYAKRYELGWRTGRDIVLLPDDLAFIQERIGRMGRPPAEEQGGD